MSAHVVSGEVEVRGVFRPVFEYVHAIGGRLRIKVPEVKRAPARAREIECRFRAVEGVLEVSANPVTGNVLFRYDPARIEPYAIMGTLLTFGYMRDPAAALSAQSPEEGTQTYAATFAQVILRVVLQALDSFGQLGVVEKLAMAVAEFLFKTVVRQIAIARA